MKRVLRRLRYWWGQTRDQAAIAEELEFHADRKRRELEDRGLGPEEAVAAARREMGNVTLALEDSRAIWIAPWLESIWQDACYAARSLRRQPVFTFVALSILTAGIGLNTALFTLFKDAVSQPWGGIPEPSRAVRLQSVDPDIGGLAGLSHPEYRHLADRSASVAGLAAWRNETVRFEDQSESRTRITLATANFFQVLAPGMERGRGFLPEDDDRRAVRAVVVLSADLWRRELGSDPDVIGRTVRLDGIPFRVIGVAPREFTGSEGSATSLWIPLGAQRLLRPNDPQAAAIDKPENCCSQVVGRLAPGVTHAQAAAELGLLSDRFRRAAGVNPRRLTVTPTSLIPARERTTVMMAGAAMSIALFLVLLLACANVSNLLLARAAARAREISVRLSLGATRRRVVRQLLTESAVLAGIAGVASLLLVTQTVPALRRMTGLAGAASWIGSVDWTVLLCTFAIAGITCLAFGLAPALHATRIQPAAALKAEGIWTRTRLPLRSLLLGVQVTVSVTFLACAGLFVRGVQQAYTLDLGFAIDDVAVVEIDLPADAYDSQRKADFLTRVATQLRTEGGPPIGLASWEPLGGSQGWAPVRHPAQTADDARRVRTMGVSPGYFQVLRIPIVAGRNFEAAERGHRSVLVNERFARLLWQGQDPIGKRFLSRHKEPIEHEVIGVVKDVYTESVDSIEPMFYNVFEGALEPKLLIDASDTQALARVSGVAAGMDARARVRVTPLAENFRDEIAMSRRTAVIAGGLGSLALALTTVGMFGVFAYLVQQRTREIGIRMALGARAADVVRLVLGGQARPIVAGLALGLAGAMGGARLLRHLLFGASPFDPVAHLGVAVVLGLAGLAASYVPVRRAVRVDPVTALRHD